jgi:hypothetical protein
MILCFAKGFYPFDDEGWNPRLPLSCMFIVCMINPHKLDLNLSCPEILFLFFSETLKPVQRNKRIVFGLYHEYKISIG